MVKVTDYERVAEVTPTQLGQFNCPKCKGLCNERSGEKCSTRGVREWDCMRCGRGWVQTPAWVRNVADAHRAAEERYSKE